MRKQNESSMHFQQDEQCIPNRRSDDLQSPSPHGTTRSDTTKLVESTSDQLGNPTFRNPDARNDDLYPRN